jgi:hypothetical protein
MPKRQLACALGLLAFFASCHSPNVSEKPVPPRRDINAVLAEHDDRLLAMPGVVGVYVGVLDDGATPCLKVMLSRPDPVLEKKLPRELGGYRVVSEVTGEIRPLKTK